MPSSHIRTLLLHESPDLDAAFSSWLLRRFGEDRYAGVRTAELTFSPVGELPEGRTAAELEVEGILAVDTGGGRLDNHGQATPTSSSLLVATDLEINNDRALEKLLRFVHLNDVTGEGIRSSDPTDQMLSLPNILRGLNVLFPANPDKVVEEVHLLFDAIYATEVEWFGALSDAEAARWLTTPNGGRVMGIISESSAAMKAGRFRKADIVVHRSSRFVGITLTRRGKLDKPPLLLQSAALLRAAESLEGGRDRCDLTKDQACAVGLQGIWFLHESLHIVSNGSNKKSGVPPTRIPWEIVLELVACGVDLTRPLPARYCDSRCSVACRLGDIAQTRCSWRPSGVGQVEGRSESRSPGSFQNPPRIDPSRSGSKS